MKIGILTWFFADNYGARAQCYAMQQTLKKMNHDVYVINYIPPHCNLLNIKMCVNHPGIKLNPIYLLRDYRRHLKLLKDLSLYRITDKINNGNDINRIGFDCVVLGSDAIFNLNHPMSDEIYYGVGINCKKITYSPSCEYMDVNTRLSEACVNSLNNMVPIGVRDDNTKRLLGNNGITDVTLTLDPTFLYDFSDLRQILNEEEYILVYTFSDWDEFEEGFRQFAELKHLKIISIGKICSWADKNYDRIDLKTWVSFFRQASYVITDSYHGLIFSIKNNKEFILLSRNDKIDKIKSLLRQFSIGRRSLESSSEISSYLREPIDYQEVNNIISKARKSCIEYIEMHLKQ